MRKKSLLTKVVALGAMTTLLASSTAFAATYSTRTLYKAGSNEKVEVATIVTGLTENDEVTYLAGDPKNPVYINQYTANPVSEGGKYVFKYTTDAANIGTTSIKMAKTASDFTGGAEVTPDSSNTVADPTAFTFKVTVDDAAEQKVIVADARSVAAANSVISLDFTGIGNNTIKTVKLNNEDVLSNVTKTDSGIKLTIPKALTTINEGDLSLTATSATLVITTEKVVKDPQVTYAGGYKVDTYKATVSTENGGTEEVEGPMFAVYGNAKDYEGCEYGFLISFDDDPVEKAYKAADANKDGDFAVAIIDPDKTMKKAYAVPYIKLSDGSYKKGGVITVTFGK